MSNLFTVTFTTQKFIHKYDAKGKIVGRIQMDTPITVDALPYAAAMSYSKADNFKIVPYVFQSKASAKGTGRDNGVGNGTKKMHVRTEGKGVKTGTLNTASKSVGTGTSSLHNAAASGNMASAINV